MKKPHAVRIAINAIPTSWLDPLLTGPHAVLGQPPYNCHDVERLLNALRDRMQVRFDEAVVAAQGKGANDA